MRTVADSSFVLPPNPEYIDFPKTDGTQTTWPPNTTRVVDHEGCVNYYDPLANHHGQHIRWRVLVAEALALEYKYPKGPNYVLRDFPKNYRLFDHNKGPAVGPRHDLYLYGPLKKKFRSINEFVPHAIWLMSDGLEPCKCKYCGSVKAQREITASLSNILRTTPTGSPSPSRVKTFRDKGKGKDPLQRSREPKGRDGRAYAAVQRAFKHLKPSPGVLKQPMLQERNSDLRAIYSRTAMHLRRWFREGEIIWCALDPPITGLHGIEGASIEFWPGIIDEVKLKTESVPRAATPKSPLSPGIPQASTSKTPEPIAADDTRGPILENSAEPLPWTIRQSTRYKVQLLAVSYSYTIDDEQVLPYQAYVPPDELISSMIDYPPDKLNFDKDFLTQFNPCPGPKAPAAQFLEAVPAYATAIQIASILSSTWCLTDDYEFRYSIRPATPKVSNASLPLESPPGPVAPQQPKEPLTLEAAIEQASRHNAQLSSSTSYYRNVTSVNPGMSQAESQQIADRVLGAQPSQLVQTRFQGLWWGSERIWVDDFIRLKVPRRMLAPNGAPNILPPSGPGKAVKAQWIAEGKDPAALGAGTRGVFLRLDGLLTVDVPNESGAMKKEARVCGMLYELADEDWEDPEERKTLDGNSANPIPGSSQQPSSSTTSPAKDPTRLSNAQENGAGSSSAPVMENVLPQAPIGYKFRPIVAPGHEFVGAMGLISGRYYPRILVHPKIKPRVQSALLRPAEEGGLTGFDNLWALEGLSGGYFNSVDPHRYKKSRLAMVQDATREALEQLQNYAETKREQQNGSAQNGGDAMEVDES
ncbi:hypothetical protein CPB84DRAFT_1675815 [Gymnopilus junonius]|uniref:Cryptic loci regulator 2 N-terminal domain-containing protein n=1 Tax=Gymnopilus junonius TaxID=109634 RepID=A0A9P5NVV9_GYMJU|nr:hypothetical protein CPB84DRAFT_1675815 [Gymnopilus junonius]